MLAASAIQGIERSSSEPSWYSAASAKNISFDRNPLSSGTPAIAAEATIASVAVIGIAW